MSPEQIAAVTSFLSVFAKMGTWPIGTIVLVVVIGPWLMAGLIAWQSRKRFEEVVQMYESNVRLVEKYEKIANNLQDVVILNTQAMTRLVDRINPGSQMGGYEW